MQPPVVTFDAGHTLVELDLDFLAQRLDERGTQVAAAALAAAAPAAWRLYDKLAPTSDHPWHELMKALIEGAGVRNADPLVAWLWEQQRHHNLWRKPIAPMIELVRDLARRGVVVAVLSNSEGSLRELLESIGIAEPFRAIIDSGLLPYAKPDPRIFHHTLEVLGMPAAKPVHIGDSWSADVEGALGVGWNAIWYRSRGGEPGRELHVPIAYDAAETRAALATFGIAS
jgi:HAD superfamily hydrolase (TIGR01509 family)